MVRLSMIDIQKIDVVARLACIRLAPEEREALAQDLAQVFTWVETLATLECPDFPPMPIPEKGSWRADTVIESVPVKRLMENAPQEDQDLFLVPRVWEGA